jgi:hypothetical protein
MRAAVQWQSRHAPKGEHMKTLDYTELKETLEECELYDARVRTYSGRGMMGEECAAIVVGDVPELCAFFVAMAYGEFEPYDVSQMAAATRTDQMGHDIVAYWPGYTLEGANDDE